MGMQKKDDMDAQKNTERQLMMAEENLKLICASEQAEEKLEEKRRKVTAKLETWENAMCQADNYLRKQEHDKIIKSERNLNDHMDRNWDLGCTRHMALTEQSQKDVLKRRVQTALRVQLNEMQQKRSMALAESIDAKQEAAASRRHQMHLGSKHNFTEKTFGPDALSFDPKHHSVAIDRRNSCWQNNAKAWAHQKGTFSEPSLGI